MAKKTKSASAGSLSSSERASLLATLKARFEKHPVRHEGVAWETVQARLEQNDDALGALQEMERTGGEPDVIGVDKKTGVVTFCDCSAESPAGRRSVCYDPEALASRKENKPKHSALGMAKEMGIELLTEDEYRALQTLGTFDAKTSSWVMTPPEMRKLGGALFGDTRYGRVFAYHNGAESYYAARGFRGALRV